MAGRTYRRASGSGAAPEAADGADELLLRQIAGAPALLFPQRAVPERVIGPDG
ncbi:hypothetical protein ACSNOH_12410 [Streptomyces sp. URMC 127]|uniref:hypothetical protein n=1 Tax=Streptomyces sp. URMC 127 TaxID=3423402 RepID=UPI003F1BA504